jgi:Golgi phosphoprotein 3 (GPP34)
MTEKANARPRPAPGLGGTGRVADDLYLIAHHEVTGRAHLQPRALGLGLAGALLCELILDGAISVAAATVTAAGPALPDDPLARDVAGRIAREGRAHLVRDWLAFLGRTCPGEIAARLARAGYLVPASGRGPWRARWVPADPDCAFAPVTRVKSALDASRPVLVTNVVLAGLAAACGLGPRLGLYLPPGSRARTDVMTRLLDPGLGEVITHTQAAVDAALLAHRI